MKRFLIYFLSLAVVFLLASPTLAQPQFPKPQTNAGFEKLKSLAGEWQGQKTDGKTVNVSYQVVSGGNSVMETLEPSGEPSMITLYHPDANKVMMTHYCSVGNQPRMSAQVPAGEIKAINFVFVDATNMAKSSDPHMHSLALNFQDKDHLTQVWTMRMDGKDMPVTFNLERKK
jgi:hypothetical protein